MSVIRGFDISQDDIDHAVAFLVKESERRGEPYTKEEVAEFTPKVQTDILNALVKRMEVRSTGASAQLVDQGGVVGGAASQEEIYKKTREERELER